MKHALDPKGWDVDIISMSFGFGKTNKTHDVIEQTILKHSSQRQILFAAAANHGNNQSYIAYPARINRVICVKSSNSYGNPSTFSPRYSQREGMAFFTLGEEVLSMWRSSWENGVRILQRRATGTSVATPIAAGIAALVLEFINQPDKPNDLPYLKEILEKFKVDPNDRMTRILEAMSDVKNSAEYGKIRYIVPWSWLKSTSDSDEDLSPRTPRLEAAYKIYECVKQ